MGQRSYAIQKAVLIPLVIDTVLLGALLLLSWRQGGGPAERLVLAILLTAALLTVAAASARRVTVGDEGIRLRKLLRTKEVDWPGITHVEALSVGNKVYLLLTTGKGFFIFSNAYDRFSLLVQDIVRRTATEKVEQDVRTQTEHAGAGWRNVLAAWFAALVMAVVIIMKFFPF